LIDYTGFEKSERRFWLDEGMDIIADSKGLYEQFKTCGSGWIPEGSWAEENDEKLGKIHVSSFNWCTKTLKLNLSQLAKMLGIEKSSINGIEFEVKVKGKPPKVNDLFCIFIQAEDENYNAIPCFDTQNHRNQRIATDNWQNINIHLDLQKHQKTENIKICYSGKDIEYWQGNYGTCFAQETVRISYKGFTGGSVGAKSLVERFKYRRTYSEIPFGTFFNDGMGKRVFIEGNEIITNYNNIADYDINTTYMFQSRLPKNISEIIKDKNIISGAKVDLCYEKAYNGNTSYSIKWLSNDKNSIFIQKFFKTEFSALENQDIIIISAINESNVYSLDAEIYWVLKLSDGKLLKLRNEIMDAKNGWIIGQTIVKYEQIKDLKIKGIYLCVEEMQENTKYELLLSHFGIGYTSKNYFSTPHEILCMKPLNCQVFINPKSGYAQYGKIIIDFQVSWEMLSEFDQNLLYYFKIYLYFSFKY